MNRIWIIFLAGIAIGSSVQAEKAKRLAPYPGLERALRLLVLEAEQAGLGTAPISIYEELDGQSYKLVARAVAVGAQKSREWRRWPGGPPAFRGKWRRRFGGNAEPAEVRRRFGGMTAAVVIYDATTGQVKTQHGGKIVSHVEAHSKSGSFQSYSHSYESTWSRESLGGKPAEKAEAEDEEDRAWEPVFETEPAAFISLFRGDEASPPRLPRGRIVYRGQLDECTGYVVVKP